MRGDRKKRKREGEKRGEKRLISFIYKRVVIVPYDDGWSNYEESVFER